MKCPNCEKAWENEKIVVENNKVLFGKTLELEAETGRLKRTAEITDAHRLRTVMELGEQIQEVEWLTHDRDMWKSMVGDKAKEVKRLAHELSLAFSCKGECRIFSLGDECPCPKCRAKRAEADVARLNGVVATLAAYIREGSHKLSNLGLD